MLRRIGERGQMGYWRVAGRVFLLLLVEPYVTQENRFFLIAAYRAVLKNGFSLVSCLVSIKSLGDTEVTQEAGSMMDGDALVIYVNGQWLCIKC